MNAPMSLIALPLLLASLVVEAQEGGVPAAPAPPVAADPARQAVVLLNKRIQLLAGAVEQLEAVQARRASAAPEHLAAERDRLAAELEQKKELYRFVEIIVVALLAIMALYVVLWHLRKADEAKYATNPNHRGLNPQDVMNVSGLSLIVFGTILVVIIADVDQQLTASVGILGALSGYLFRGLHDTPLLGSERPVSGSAGVGKERPPAGGAHSDGDGDAAAQENAKPL